MVIIGKKKFFIVKKKEGITFSQQSGDNNKIHTNFISGYNSPFGENIIHGTLVIIKFLNIVKLKNYECIKVCFEYFIGF